MNVIEDGRTVLFRSRRGKPAGRLSGTRKHKKIPSYGKYYSRNSMRAIRAGLDRYLNKNDINLSMMLNIIKS